MSLKKTMEDVKTTSDLLQNHYRTKTPEQILADELGEPYRRYRELWHRAMRFEERPAFPIHVDLELVYACNLKCVMCPFGDPTFEHPDYDRQQLDRRVLRALFEEGKQHNLYSVRFNALSEPLLSKDLPDLIALAREHGVLDTFITTNATLLTRERSRALIEAGLTHILISVDGATVETYEGIRIGAKYEQVVENIHGFLEERAKLGRRFPLVRMTFVKMSVNQHETDAFVEQWKDKVDYLSVAGYLNNIQNEERSAALSLGRSLDDVDRFHCWQPWTRCVVYANGDVFPCCSNYGRPAPVGNLHRQSMRDIWTSDEVRFIQDIHKAGDYRRHPICADCVKRRDYVSFDS